MGEIITRNIKASLAKGLEDAIIQIADLANPYKELKEIVFEVPKDKSHGNFSSNVAFMLAKSAKKPPQEVAKAIVAKISPNRYVSEVKVAGPGFINFYLNKTWLLEVLNSLITYKTETGNNNDLADFKIQLEFVSANPVGPMNVVNARAAALGDTLGRLFTACGATVWREYYVNDFGVQIWTLGRSIDARYRELLGETAPFPEEGYRGDYIYDMAKQIIAEKGNTYLQYPEKDRITLFRDWGYQRILLTQRKDLENYGVKYDCWFSERSLHESGAVSEALQELITKGLTYEDEGAQWLKTSAFGDDKDRVLRTADGRTTYFTSDIAYHINKFNRGFDLVIDIWGPDHHGYIPRVKAAMAALGIDPNRLEVLIAQQINLLKDGQPFKMSKRRGEFITMNDLLEEVGNDVARWFFLMRSPESHLDFDLNLAKSQSDENPVFYVQYAHARICSLFRQVDCAHAREQMDFSNIYDFANYLDGEEEALLEKAALFPEVIIDAAKRREPQLLTGYLLELATLFHSYYNRRRFIVDELKLTQSRLAVAQGLSYIFEKGLSILGVSAPERM